MGIKGLREKEPEERLREAKPSGRILLSPATADVVRKLARYENRTLDQLVQAMIQLYVPATHPNLELVTEPDDPADETEFEENVAQGAAPRRGRKSTDTRGKGG